MNSVIPVRFSTLSGDYLLGSFWMPTVMCVDQAEFIPSTCRFYVLYPSIPAEYEENKYIFKPHPFIPFNSSIAQTYREGVMVLISRRGDIEEVRVKRENTVELQVVNKKICFNGQEVSCADGVWEMALRNDLLVPVRSRQMKDETTNVYSKLLAPPTLEALLACKATSPSFAYKCVFGENERIVQDALNSYVYQTPLKYAEGKVEGSKFYFECTENTSSQLKDRKEKKITVTHTSVVKKYLVTDFFPLTAKSVFITSEPKEVEQIVFDERKGVAVLHFQGDEVGVVTEGNKLYTLPGGKIEYGEDVIPALTRELREELPLGWVQIETVGPIESGLCSYFVALQDRPIPGVMYVPLTDVRLSPWVVRVVDHFRSLNHADKVLNKHVFRDDRVPEQFFGKLDEKKIYYYPDLNKEDLLPLSSDWVRVGYYLVQRGTRFSKYVKCQDAVITNAEKELIQRLPLSSDHIGKITGWGINLIRQKMHAFGCIYSGGVWGVG
jgi:8-oxo-dGTP pyrophosphatase MutT (NUDIX family)